MTQIITIKDDLELIVRKATVDDAEGMISLMQKVSHESKNITWEPGEFSYTIEQERKFIENAHNTENNLFVIGLIDNEIVSVANVSSSNRTRLRHLGEIGISVLKKYWNMGVGTSMMQYIIDWAKNVGLKKLNLSVRIDHEAGIALYRKMGFIKEGIRSRMMFIDGDFVDTMDMGLEL